MRIPNWLKALPTGKYSLTEFVEITKKSKPSLVRTLTRLGLEKEYRPCKDSNWQEVIYFWKNE